jgi:hypothetical protein
MFTFSQCLKIVTIISTPTSGQPSKELGLKIEAALAGARVTLELAASQHHTSVRHNPACAASNSESRAIAREPELNIAFVLPGSDLRLDVLIMNVVPLFDLSGVLFSVSFLQDPELLSFLFLLGLPGFFCCSF